MLSRTATGRRIAAATLAVTGALSALAGTAGASVTPPPATSLTGADLSWPQCAVGMGTAERPTKGLPGPNADATFVVLGLTNGPAFTPNPCLPAQTKAQQAAHRWTAAYSVVSYPTSAQLSEYGQAGPYRGNDLFTRLRNVGWSQAQFNLATMKVAGLRSPIVWIDVEPVPGHPWGSTGANNAVIDGVVAGYRHGGFATGFYSYANGWNQITGGRRDSSPTWVPGLPTRSTALARCYQRSFSGGPTVIGQWYDGTGDFDVTCPWVAGSAPTPSPLARYQNTTLAYGSRGFAVQALQRAIGVTPSGFYGTWTQATVAKVQRATTFRSPAWSPNPPGWPWAPAPCAGAARTRWAATSRRADGQTPPDRGAGRLLPHEGYTARLTSWTSARPIHAHHRVADHVLVSPSLGSAILGGGAAITLSLALAACSGPPAPVAVKSSAPSPSAPATPTARATPTGPTWPLTGVTQPAGAPTRAALVVKVEDSVDARPQSGLNAADLVFEELVEGGITRFAVVLHSTLPATIGPVRSVRPMDAPVSDPLHALFAYSGGIPPFVAQLRATSAQDVGASRYAGPYRREGSRPAPHNLYADPAQLYALADGAHRTPPPPLFRFAADAASATASSGAPVAHLTLGFSGSSRPGWTWDAGSAAWLRDESGRPATTLPAARISAANVVVLRVGEHNTGYVDPAGNPVPEAEVTGSGQALIASGGHTVSATWSKPSRSAPFTLTAAGGAPVLLAPGRTWVELVPTSGSVASR